MKTVEEYVAWLRAQVGVRESPPNSNRVKYWDMLNPKYQGQPWCLALQIAALRAVGFGRDAAPDIYSCTELMSWAKYIGALVRPEQIRPGDLALFNFNADPKAEHIGGCVAVDLVKRTVTCVEGNTSGTGSQSDGGEVMVKTRGLSLVLGAYRPRYEEDDMTQEQFNIMLETYLKDQRGKPVNPWAKDAWEKAVKLGLVDGTSPQGYMAREQLITVLGRLGLLS